MISYTEEEVDGRVYRAYDQQGSLSCGPASVVNAIYHLTGQEADEAPFRHDTGVQMTTKTIASKIRELKFGEQGLKLLKKFEAFEGTAAFQANPTLRPSTHYAFLYNADERNDCADIGDIQKSIRRYGLHSTNGKQVAPRVAIERARTALGLAGAPRCSIMGVKWTETIDEEGGGHWVTVAGRRPDNSLIVLDSEAGIVTAADLPAYSQGSAGESGFFDGYFIEIWAA